MSEEATLDKFVGSDKNKSSEWVMRSLGNLAEYQNGKGFKKSEWGDEGYPIIRIQNLTGQQDDFNYYNGELDEKYEVKPGDTLLSWSATIDVFQWKGGNAALNQHIFRVDTSDEVNDTFYRFKLEHLLPRLVALSHGSTMQHVRKADLVNTDAKVPPLPEQRKIATVLYNVDQAIQKTEEIIGHSWKVKKGLVQNLLTEGTHEHSEYDTYRLGPIDLTKPEDWELKSFGEFSYRVQDGPHITPDYVDEGIPFVSSQNVSPFQEKFDYSQYEKYISEETYEEINQNCRPEKNDLIISRRATIGPTQLIRHNEQFGFFVGVAIIKTNDTVYNPFLEQLMNWSVMMKLWHLKSPGSTMKTLNLGTIKEQKVPLPPLQEQKAIAEILRSQDDVIANNERYKESLQRLKQGLMQDLLSGTVRTTDNDIEVSDEIAQHG